MIATFEELTAQFQALLLTGDTNSEQLNSLVNDMWKSAPSEVIQQWTEIAQRLGYINPPLSHLARKRSYMRYAPAYHSVNYVMPTATLDRISLLATKLKMSDQDIIRLAIEAYDPPAPVIPEPEPPRPMPGFSPISEHMFAIMNATTKFDKERR